MGLKGSLEVGLLYFDVVFSSGYSPHGDEVRGMALASENAKASRRNGRETSNLGHVRWEGKLLVGFLLSQPRV